MVKWGYLTRFSGYRIIRRLQVHDPAPKITPDPVIDSKERSQRNRAGLTTSFSLASSPALSMCCGFTSENLPIGLQIGGKPFAEQTVLNVAYAYQHATDWHGRRPPI